MRIRLDIAYNGNNYNGWQKQNQKPTIQQTIEDAYFRKLNEKITLQSSGRTDTGVHALKQVAHFETNLNIIPEKFAFILNSELPEDITILSSKLVDNAFHARYSVKSKTYMYLFYNNISLSPILNNKAYFTPQPLNFDNIQNAINHFIGKHDFSSFCKKSSSNKNCTREIYNITINHFTKDIFSIEINGNGFLHNMVRIIVGTLIDVGTNKLKSNQVLEIIKSHDRCLSSRTMPPYALYLKDVFY